MPAHRKPTHRPKLLAASLMVALTCSGVAFAAQLGEQGSVRNSQEPISVTRAPSSPASSTAVSDDRDHDDTRRARPSRTAPTERGELSERTDKNTAEAPTTTPTTSAVDELTPTTDPTPTVTAEAEADSATPKADRRTTRKAPSAAARIMGGTNAARADAGLPALAKSSCLAAMAQRHAERMAAAGRLYHQELGTVMETCGMSTAGENVAMNYAGAAGMVDQWLDSPGHRANLMSRRFSLLGVGVARAPDGAWYGVQVFGAR